MTHKPEFSVSVLPGNVWTKEFTAEDCTVTEGKGDATAINADLIYQYSADNGRTWNAFNDNTNARQAFISTPEIRFIKCGRCIEESWHLLLSM